MTAHLGHLPTKLAVTGHLGTLTVTGHLATELAVTGHLTTKLSIVGHLRLLAFSVHLTALLIAALVTLLARLPFLDIFQNQVGLVLGELPRSYIFIQLGLQLFRASFLPGIT